MKTEKPIQLLGAIDPMNVLGEQIPELSAEVRRRVDQGRTTRTQILEGSVDPLGTKIPYARSKVEIDFKDEDNLLRCVRLLQWSDEYLRKHRDRGPSWDWQRSFRDRMKIEFAVLWYTPDMYEKRKDAFLEVGHADYYKLFGATPQDLKVTHHILTKQDQADYKP